MLASLFINIACQNLTNSRDTVRDIGTKLAKMRIQEQKILNIEVF